MTQETIFKFLRDHPNELFASEELAIFMKGKPNYITGKIRKMTEYGFPVVKLMRGHKPLYAYIDIKRKEFSKNEKGHGNSNGKTMVRI